MRGTLEAVSYTHLDVYKRQILYFPMLIFSGTTVPLEILPKAMQAAVRFFPFTMGVALMKETFLGIVAENAVGTVGVMIGVTVFCTAPVSYTHLAAEKQHSQRYDAFYTPRRIGAQKAPRNIWLYDQCDV